MLIKESHVDVPTVVGGEGTMRTLYPSPLSSSPPFFLYVLLPPVLRLKHSHHPSPHPPVSLSLITLSYNISPTSFFLHRVSKDTDTTLLLKGIFIFHPSIPGYPRAKFPGVVLFSEIYQGKTNHEKEKRGRNIFRALIVGEGEEVMLLSL